MALRRIKVNGRRVWQARVAYKGARKSTIRDSWEAARQAENELLSELKAKAAREEQAGAAPAILRTLLEAYAADMQARGKGEESVARVEHTARAIEAVTPELLDRPVSRIGDAEVFAFRNARARYSQRADELHRQAKRLAAAEGRPTRRPSSSWKPTARPGRAPSRAPRTETSGRCGRR